MERSQGFGKLTLPSLRCRVGSTQYPSGLLRCAFLRKTPGHSSSTIFLVFHCTKLVFPIMKGTQKWLEKARPPRSSHVCLGRASHDYCLLGHQGRSSVSDCLPFCQASSPALGKGTSRQEPGHLTLLCSFQTVISKKQSQTRAHLPFFRDTVRGFMDK